MNIHISDKNSKLGKTGNINIPPIPGLICRKNAPCFNICYARKFYTMREGVRKTWNENLIFYYKRPKQYFDCINQYLSNNPESKFFRFHTSGDIVDKRYYRGMIRVAKQNPNIFFLAYTKKYELIDSKGKEVENLNIILSMFKGLKYPDEYMENYPKSYIVGYYDKLPKENLFYCHKFCSECRKCWFATPMDNIIFKRH